MLSIGSLLPPRSLRLEGENVEHTRVLAELRVALPPIIVHHPSMRIIDGMHRVAAARRRGETTIHAVLFTGDEREAFALAVRANTAHGLPLSYADRAAAAVEILRYFPGRSDRWVAATTGLSAATVKNIRDRTIPPGQEPGKRMGRDGRMRPVNGSAGRKHVQELVEKNPGASLRQLARAAGVSPNTVREVRRRMLQEKDTAPDAGKTAGQEDRAASGEVAAQVTEPSIPEPHIPEPSIDGVLRRLSKDPSLRFTESGRSTIRWFFSRVLRPREWAGVIDGLPPHTAFVLAAVADRCAAEWRDLACRLRDVGGSESDRGKGSPRRRSGSWRGNGRTRAGPDFRSSPGVDGPAV
ncbi:ParB/RepB/Spo0J family partition protein [Microbispora sp. H13382]|uniref:ParB/RepB/Spo0J family partition protein n=1 Tax=Microbispora sp. H13382 TaxID=2729112 RepID=UPI0015FFC4FB|nr:ParB N-terminal domain-containing protein [Microbispora sp. H13382]